jgi:hypothetical protein
MTVEELRALSGSDVVDPAATRRLNIHPSRCSPSRFNEPRSRTGRGMRQDHRRIHHHLRLFGDYDPSVVDLVRSAGFKAAAGRTQRSHTIAMS